jgi:hypothetical protein
MIADERIAAHQFLDLLDDLPAADKDELFEFRVQLRPPEFSMRTAILRRERQPAT